MKSSSILISMIFLFLIPGCEEKESVERIYGCTDSSAYNYDSQAQVSTDDCIYECPAGASFVLYTLDNGLTWEKRCSFQDSSSTIVDASVIDENNIWICTSYPATIVHITDGGQTWNLQYRDDSRTNFFNYIEMFDGLTGVAMGDGHNDVPLILHTTDGGLTWEETASSAIGEASADTWRRIQFLDASTGYFKSCCSSPQLLYKTIDGGETWSPTDYPGYLQVLQFYDMDIGLVIEGEEQVYRTIDGGETWDTFSTGHSGWGMDIAFSPTDPAQVWLVANEVLFSADTGRTWQLHDDTIRGRDIEINHEYAWLFRPPNLYQSLANGSGGWEQVIPDFPENAVIMDAMDIHGDILVIPGFISF